MHPTTNLVSTIARDRLREADAVRLARPDRQPPASRRSRRLRSLAARAVFATLR
jgi:hypothetical protein